MKTREPLDRAVHAFRTRLKELGEKFGTDPLSSLDVVVVTLFFGLQGRITALRDEKAHEGIMREILDDWIGPNARPWRSA